MVKHSFVLKDGAVITVKDGVSHGSRRESSEDPVLKASIDAVNSVLFLSLF